MDDDATKKIPLRKGEGELVGKTIAEVWREGYAEYDDEPFFLMRMTDGTVWRFSGNYGGYTDGSQDEYIRFIRVNKVK